MLAHRNLSFLGLACACLTALALPVHTQARNDFAALLALNEELAKIQRPTVTAGVPDYSAGAVAQRRQQLTQLRARLDAIDPGAWPVADRVDYLLVRAQMNGIDFEQRVVRPWARDPNLYVDLVSRAPYADLPAPADRLPRVRESLQAVPKILDQARATLSAPPGELARMAIRELEKSDGVNQGEPRRPVPPAGVIGWYKDLLARIPSAQPELLDDARRAASAVEAYRDWLVKQEPTWKTPAGLGLENYGWFLRNVRMLPYSVEQVRLIGERELQHGRTLLKVEEHKNRALPPLEPVHTAEEHERRTREGETLIRTFVAREKLMTIPADIPPTFEPDTFWIAREGGKRHFWEELSYRDPLNNFIHASIPGHRFDGLMSARSKRPIRRTFRDGPRTEGWGFYLEEMFLQAGILADRPRARELFYIAQLKRGARIPAELKMQSGEFSLQQAIDYLEAQVPYMEDDLARYDLSIYLRRPAAGMNYTIGKAQLEHLLADRANQLGEKFDLGTFHDEFLAAGPIPIALIRWEMTGLDDEVKGLWKPGS